MGSIEIKENQDLTALIQELDEDVKLSEFNLREKSMLCSSIWAKWLSRLYKEKSNLDKIGTLKSKILKKKLDSNIQDSILKIKNEEKIANNDENIKKLNLLAKQTQDKIDFIERALTILSNFGYNIKNCIEIVKLNLK